MSLPSGHGLGFLLLLVVFLQIFSLATYAQVILRAYEKYFCAIVSLKYEALSKGMLSKYVIFGSHYLEMNLCRGRFRCNVLYLTVFHKFLCSAVGNTYWLLVEEELHMLVR